MSDTMNETAQQRADLKVIGDGREYQSTRDEAVRCLILDHLLLNKPGAEARAEELAIRLKPRGQLAAVK